MIFFFLHEELTLLEDPMLPALATSSSAFLWARRRCALLGVAFTTQVPQATFPMPFEAYTQALKHRETLRKRTWTPWAGSH